MAIVKMKKVSLVVLDSERRESLKSLRKMGLVHLEAIEGQGAKLAAFKETYADCDKAISILSEIKTSKKEEFKQVSLSNEESLVRTKQIVEFSDKKKSLFDSISQNIQELSRFEKWGNVSLEDLQFLADKGIFVYLYEIPFDKYSLIGNDSKTILVNTLNKTARFLLVSETELTERPSDFPADAYSVPLPNKSTLTLNKEIESYKKEIAKIDAEILRSKKYLDAIKKYKKLLLSDIEFENVYSGMEHEESLENDNSVKLAWISGYVPLDSYESFKNFCVQNQWGFTADDADEEDLAVPTKLKNNKFVSLIYPLMDFLDVTPGYNEFDISGWFLLFFSIFFGMIFADAGYGAIITILALFFIFKNAFSKKKVQPVFGLMMILGLCATAYGILTCSWFGIEAEKLPKWMVDISFAPISTAKVGEDIANTNQKTFCFILALVQLSIAHIKCFIKDIKSAKCLGDLGALLELFGMFYVVMSLVVDGTKYPLLSVTEQTVYLFGVLPLQFLALGVLGIGFELNFVFSNYEGSVGKSVLESCKNIISVLLGVVNVFSDIVSYIRLWAVALAGAAISSTVNTMAGPMFGKLAFFVFGIVLVVFGHGLNNILNLLSVIVHGVRLNTLEFSQHLGMAWTGTKYRPFKESEEN